MIAVFTSTESILEPAMRALSPVSRTQLEAVMIGLIGRAGTTLRNNNICNLLYLPWMLCRLVICLWRFAVPNNVLLELFLLDVEDWELYCLQYRYGSPMVVPIRPSKWLDAD